MFQNLFGYIRQEGILVLNVVHKCVYLTKSVLNDKLVQKILNMI